MAICIDDHTLEQILRAQEAAGHGQQRAVLAYWADRLGCSVDVIYRQLRARYGKRRHVARTTIYDDALVLSVAEIKERGRLLGLGEREISTNNARAILADLGVPGADRVSDSTINRRLVQLGARAAQRRRRVEADYAGQVALMDFSRSKYLQVRRFDETRGDYLIEISGRSLSYKDPDGAFRTWVVSYVDDYSRLQLARCFCATGESHILGLEFLSWAWTRPEDAHPLRYPPETLQLDRGAFQKSRRAQEALQAIGVTLRPAQSKEAQGKVERRFRTLWQRFELVLAVRYGEGHTLHLADYNAMLHEYMVAEMRRPHPVYKGRTCEHVYRTSLVQHPPRTLETDLVRLAFDVQERVVDAYGCIQLDGALWEVPERHEHLMLAPGTRIRVLRSATGDLLGQVVDHHHQQPFRLRPWEAHPYGDFHGAPKQTLQQKLRRQVEPHLRKPLAPSEPDGKVAYLPPRPTAITPESPFADTDAAPDYLPATEARVLIGRRLAAYGRTYADVAEYVEPVIDQLTSTDVETILGAILAKKTA